MASIAHSTARAMAHAQTSTTNRRALLGGLAVAPLAAQAEPTHPDAVLLALEQRRAAAEALYRDAADRADALEDVGFPQKPDALFFRPRDYKLQLERFATFDGEGCLWFYASCRPFDSQQHPPSLRREQQMWPEKEERQDRIAEILQAYDSYTTAIARAQKDSGFAAVYALAKTLGNDLKIIETSILNEDPATLDGLAVKAMLLQSRIDIDCDVYEEAVAVIQDIVRMAKSSEFGRARFRELAAGLPAVA